MEFINKKLILVYHSKSETLTNDRNISAGISLSFDSGHKIKSYHELLFKLAELNFYNKRFQLLFRGQEKDYPINKDNLRSNLYPSILRVKNKSFKSKKRKNEIIKNFERLKKTEKLLDEVFGGNSWLNKYLNNNQILKWAIIQHYEICTTPLLDVTGSLQTALTFAIGEKNEGYLYVLGFPQRAGPISVSIESNTQLIDLSQICPPEALRPHFQNGILAGDFPSYDHIDKTHGKNGMNGNNFSCRLLSKFHLTNCKNWKAEGFHLTPKDILFPNEKDDFYKELRNIKNRIY